MRNINTNVKYKINGISYDKSASMIEPGIYQIETIQWTDGTYHYSFKVNTKKNNINLKFGAFKIEPGECLYLGDMIINKHPNIKDRFKISDESALMMQSMNNVYFNRLHSRIKFYSLLKENDLIRKNNNGKYYVCQK